MTSIEPPVLELPNVSVTNTKVILFGTTYFIRNITSVKVVEHSVPRMVISPLVAIVGILVLMMAPGLGVAAAMKVIGVAAVIFGIAYLLFRYGRKYELVLTTGASEQHGVTTPTKSVATRIQAAINIAVENQAARR